MVDRFFAARPELGPNDRAALELICTTFVQEALAEYGKQMREPIEELVRRVGLKPVDVGGYLAGSPERLPAAPGAPKIVKRAKSRT